MQNSSFKLTISIILISLNSLTFATTRFIIKYKTNVSDTNAIRYGGVSEKSIRSKLMQPLSQTQLNQVASILNNKISDINKIATGAHVIEVDSTLSKDQVLDSVKKIKIITKHRICRRR